MSTLSYEDALEFTEDSFDLDPFDDLDDFEHDKMLEIYQAHPSLCQQRMSDEALPLHHILQYRPSLELVKCVYDAHPEAIEEVDAIEYTPLHVACLYRCSLEVVEFLAKAYPDACKKWSCYGGAPIDLARQHKNEKETSSSSNNNRGVVRALFKLRPHVRFHKDTKGSPKETPQQLYPACY